ncbi:MCE family protein [Mycobacterium syngnathidarum]
MSGRHVVHEVNREKPRRDYKRPLAGLLAVAGALSIVMFSVARYNGAFTESAPITVLSDRAGLLMDAGAKVKFHGAQVGTVANVIETPGGGAELQLAIQPDQLKFLPADVGVQIGANTVFGAKSVELIAPPNPSGTTLQAGQTLDSRHVTVEVNTIFQRLNSLLLHIDPVKLNQSVGAISTAFGGRGETFGHTLTDFNDLLGKLEPSLPELSHDLEVLPEVATAYADAAPDLLTTIDNTSRISSTMVEQKVDLNRLLLGSIGLGDIGSEVLAANKGPFEGVMRLLVPTTDLSSDYHEAITCSLTGIAQTYVTKPPSAVPGVYDLAALSFGSERYRYPQDLPKVAASGGPQCQGQLPVQYNAFPPFVVADIGTNRQRYGNQGPLLNSDGLKRFLFGQLDGPPRNSAQIGQPG